ncbi:hypothetical protein, partial [Nocardioides malaquae]|uniref:hypothetical protein n=1 Tax=Nocardioides malaquae TaxID=2773426 RepID=UPI001D0D5199
SILETLQSLARWYDRWADSDLTKLGVHSIFFAAFNHYGYWWQVPQNVPPLALMHPAMPAKWNTPSRGTQKMKTGRAVKST